MEGLFYLACKWRCCRCVEAPKGAERISKITQTQTPTNTKMQAHRVAVVVHGLAVLGLRLRAGHLEDVHRPILGHHLADHLWCVLVKCVNNKGGAHHHDTESFRSTTQPPHPHPP